MSYSTNRRPNALADRRWRFIHSKWMLAVILGAGLLSFVGFVYIALRVRTRRFWIAGIVGCVGSVLAWVGESIAPDTQEKGDSNSWGGTMTVLVWLLLIGYGVFMNRSYLRWRASRTEANAWYNQPEGSGDNPFAAHEQPLAPPPTRHRSPTTPRGGQAPSAYPGTPTTPFDVDTASYYATTPASAPHPQSGPPPYTVTAPTAPAAVPPTPNIAPSAGSTDVNSGTADQLAAGLRIQHSLALRIVDQRSRAGRFADLDSLTAGVGLQPHEMIKIGRVATFGGGQPAVPSPSSTPRLVDPPAPTPSPSAPRKGGRIVDY